MWKQRLERGRKERVIQAMGSDVRYYSARRSQAWPVTRGIKRGDKENEGTEEREKRKVIVC